VDIALMTGRYRRAGRADERAVPPPEAGQAGADAALVRAMADGDEGALARLWAEHAAALLSYLHGLAGDRFLAEELLQDSLLAAWGGAAGFRGDASVRTWLFGIGRRQAVQRLARSREHPGAVVDDSGLAGLPAAEPGPEAVMLARSDVAAVRAAMGELPALHREVLELVFAHGLSVREAARVLGVPDGTVKSRLSNARRSLAAAVSRSPVSARHRTEG
jgi:RNA polymerase sigma-70 factor, ECF subfamily